MKLASKAGDKRRSMGWRRRHEEEEEEEEEEETV
jgi:hypothetical protein